MSLKVHRAAKCAQHLSTIRFKTKLVDQREFTQTAYVSEEKGGGEKGKDILEGFVLVSACWIFAR